VDITPPGSAGQPYARSRSYWAGSGNVGQVWFLCDPIGIGSPSLVTLPNEQGVVFTLNPKMKGSPGVFHLGAPDPGAGQIYWPLNHPPYQPGNLHAFNPGVLASTEDAFTPTFTSINFGDSDLNCRWVARTRLMGFSNRRTFLVTQAADGGLEYRTFDFRDAPTAKAVEPDGAQRSTQPSLDIRGGRETTAGFTFANKGYSYEVAAGPGGGEVVISRHGERIATEDLIAWTVAPKP